MHGNCKKVGQYSMTELNPSGIGRLLLKEWDSLTEASRTLGISHSAISSCCYGRIKSAGGYYWSFR